MSEEAARRPAISAFLTEAERFEASLLGDWGDFSSLVRGVSGALPPESHVPPPSTRRSGRSLPRHRRFTAYLSLSTDRLSSDHRLDRTDHPLLRSGYSMVIGSVRPMIGKGPIGLWGLSKRFIATTSGLIGMIDRFGAG